MVNNTIFLQHYQNLLLDILEKSGMNEQQVQDSLAYLQEKIYERVTQKYVDRLSPDQVKLLQRLIQGDGTDDDIAELLNIDSIELTNDVMHIMEEYLANLNANLPHLQQKVTPSAQ